MQSNFDQCLEWLLEHEGGYVNHPKDPGGETNLGVTKKVYQNWCTEQDVFMKDMKDLTFDDVKPIYKNNYWDRVKGDDLPGGIDWSMFDWAVNSGSATPARTLQSILGVTSDGVIGPITIDALDGKNISNIISRIYIKRQVFYESLNSFDTFGAGWSKRNQHTRDQALTLISSLQ